MICIWYVYEYSHHIFIQFLEMKWNQIPNPEPRKRLLGYAVVALWTKEVDDNRHHIPHAAEGFPKKFLAEVGPKSTKKLPVYSLWKNHVIASRVSES